MRDLVDYLVRPDASLREVIQIIDRGAAQIALVVDAKNKLLGVITDGDIRRAMLRNESLMGLAESIMFRDFRALPTTATEEEALAFMRLEKLHQIPAIDEQGRLVRLFLLEELIKPKKTPKPSRHYGRRRGQAFAPTYTGLPQADAACWRKAAARNHSGAVH